MEPLNEKTLIAHKGQADGTASQIKHSMYTFRANFFKIKKIFKKKTVNASKSHF